MDDKALFTILRCAENTEGQFERNGMLKILRGRDSRKLSKLKLDHLDEYGALSFMEKSAVQAAYPEQKLSAWWEQIKA